MPKTKLDKSAIVLQLKNQLNKIEEFCKIFDAGNQQICEDIAVKLRVIFHNGGANKSLLYQLKLTEIPFIDTAKKYDPLKPNYLNAHAGLVNAHTSSQSPEWKYVPMLKSFEEKIVTFENWWDGKKVIVDPSKNAFTRRKLILEVAETDGGAHVDDALNSDYLNLSRNNSLGWRSINPETKEDKPMNNPVPPSIRQIAFETLLTFSRINIEQSSKLR